MDPRFRTPGKRGVCPKLPPLELGVRVFTQEQQTLRIRTDLRASEYGDIWPAGHALAQFLEDEPTWIKDKRVLELGAGVGYVGLKAATLGASRVVLTDQKPLLPVLRDNTRHNAAACAGAAVAELDWNAPRDREVVCSAAEAFEVVAAADVIYEEQCVEPFIRTLEQVWSASEEAGVRGVVCLLAITNRDRATGIVSDFFRALHDRSFTCSEIIPSSARRMEQQHPVHWYMCLRDQVSIHLVQRDPEYRPGCPD